VLFDLDGTLADSVPLILRCYRHTLAAHGGREPDEAGWLASLGRPLRVQFGALARSEAELDALVETYVQFQRRVHDEMVRPFPGVPDVLDALAEGGVRLGIVTSKRREMTGRTLRVCGIASRFQAIITPDDVDQPKPDAAPVLAAVRQLGDPAPGRVLMVGDAPVDILAGRAAGVRTAAALWGPIPRAALEEAGPDFFVEEPGALLRLGG
jgi:pyrophosphatase PpaX